MDNFCRELEHSFNNFFLSLSKAGDRSRRLSFFGHLHRTDPYKTITVLYKPALWVLLMIGDGGLIVPDNPGYEQWRPTCDQ